MGLSHFSPAAQALRLPRVIRDWWQDSLQGRESDFLSQTDNPFTEILKQFLDLGARPMGDSPCSVPFANAGAHGAGWRGLLAPPSVG